MAEPARIPTLVASVIAAAAAEAAPEAILVVAARPAVNEEIAVELVEMAAV